MCSWDNNSLDDLVDIFDDTITSILNRLVPKHTKSFRVQSSNVWFDDDCRAAKRLIRLKAWILQPRSYHRICDVKHGLFWKCQIASNSKNLKKLWNQIKNFLGRTKWIAQSKHSDDTFANFFQDKVEKIRWETVNAVLPSYSESSGE